MSVLYRIAMQQDVKLRTIKGMLKKLCLVFLVASMCHGAAYPSPIKEAQYITDKMIVEIARKTLDGKQLPGQAGRDQLEKRSVEVRTWLESIGGDNWYRNYLKRFGAPTSVEELKSATLIGLFESRLGYYYVRTLPASTESTTVLSCSAPNFEKSPTLKAQCALANRNAAMAFNDAKDYLNNPSFSGRLS